MWTGRRKRAQMGIGEFRREIDAVDGQILDLLNRRAEVVVRVGEEKAKGNIAYHSPQREGEIIDRLTRESRGPFPDRGIKAVYREILSACLSAPPVEARREGADHDDLLPSSRHRPIPEVARGEHGGGRASRGALHGGGRRACRPG